MRKLTWAWLAAALILAPGRGWSEDAPPAAGSARPEGQTPVPASADVAKAKRRIRMLYADEFQAAQGSAQKAKLVEKLLANAQESDSEPVDRFVLLTAARDLAVQAVEPDLVLRTIDELTATYAVDRLKMMAECLRKTAQIAADPKYLGKLFEGMTLENGVVSSGPPYDPRVDLDALAKIALEGAREGLLLRQYNQAAQLAKLARSMAGKTKTVRNNYELSTEADLLLAEVAAAKKAAATTP